MKNILLAFLLVNTTVVTAQVRFNHQIDLEFPFHVITSVLPTDSCYYATGVITDTTNSSYSVGNIFLKFDLQGGVEYYKKLSFPTKFYETWLGDLTPTPDGGFVDVGITQDSTVKALFLKYSLTGDTLFTKEFFNPFYPEESFLFVAQVRIDEDGNYFVLCGIDTDPDGVNGDIYILKLDTEGNLLQSHTFGGQYPQIPRSLLLEPDGGKIVGANIKNEGQVSQNFFSRTHVFKLDESGELEWEYQSPPGQLTDHAWDMLKTSDGGLVVSSGKGVEISVNSTTGQLRWNGYLFKLASNHSLQWDVELRGTRPSASSGLTKIVEAQDGSGFVGIGRLGEDISTGEEIFGSWVVKVSPEGDSLWARYYSIFDEVNSKPHPYDLKNTPDGGYIIVGETRPETPPQAQRAWIMKLDEHGCLIPGCEEGDSVSTSIELPVEPKLQLAIYPNPTSDFLNFQLRTPMQLQSANFRIMDAQGQVVKEINSHGARDTHIVPVSDWAAGVYFLQYIEEGKVRVSEKFMVSK